MAGLKRCMNNAGLAWDRTGIGQDWRGAGLGHNWIGARGVSSSRARLIMRCFQLCKMARSC